MSTTTTSKKLILESVRRNRPTAAPLPALAHAWTTYADRRSQFISVLESVGGRAFVAANVEEMNYKLRQLPAYETALKVASVVSGVESKNVNLSTIHSPHDLADVDAAVLPGQFAVAENAAVWVTDQHVPLRALYFICQHLVLVVPADQIVDHMHAAFERINTSNNGESEFAEPRFGAFISGPSKTADIEQCLVIGAHGPRSLTVCLLET